MRTLVFDTRLVAEIKPLLSLDSISNYRLPVAVNAEGDPTGGRTKVFDDSGTITEATDSEVLVAAQRGTRIDKVLCTRLGLDIQGGDFVVVNGLATYEVVEVDVRRLFMRSTLRIEA